MDDNEEFQGILKGITSKDLRELFDRLPDPEMERTEISTEDTTVNPNWGNSGSLKYRRDY